MKKEKGRPVGYTAGKETVLFVPEPKPCPLFLPWK